MPVNDIDEAQWAEFFKLWHLKMVKMGLKLGASNPDAEDAASAVAINVQQSWKRWTAALDKDNYLRKSIRNELGGTRKKNAARQDRETRWAQHAPWPNPHDAIVDRYNDIYEFDIVRQYLAITSQRQRQILSWLYLRHQAGWDVKDIAAALRVSPDTIRRHRQNARRLLQPFLTGTDHEHRRWMRAGERAHEDFHRGRTTPFDLRPMIRNAWALAADRGVNPQRGTRVVLVDRNELDHRRQQSPLPIDSPTLAEVDDLATRNELLAVILDFDDIVLHRGGSHHALVAADRLGFVDGARWDIHNAGVTAAGLAHILGSPATVNRWEHTFPDQHGLCCVAVPIRTPDGRHITLNLTATTDRLANVPRAIHRQLDAVAQRLHRQLWSPAKGDQS